MIIINSYYIFSIVQLRPRQMCVSDGHVLIKH